eukprot:TRINITY_DN9323_c0_g1_i1.p1 TRINITY_DN9323_c0_g1~~TRINITY_DN9323_c0_g1_i1.p1  ORF type:complete len:496 (+),score=210.55 TRINITY_DN9323_c0_g1_i1:162-1649(+)
MNTNTPTVAIVRAIHDWNGDAGQLTFVAGDLIHVKSKNEDGFWEGISTSGAFGYFPANYTEEVANLGNVTRARAFTLPAPSGRNEGMQTFPIVKANSPKLGEKEKHEKPEKNGLFSKFKRGKDKHSKSNEKESTSQSTSVAPSNSSYSSVPSFDVPQIQQINGSPQLNQSDVVYARTLCDFDAGRNVSHLSFSSGEFLRVKERYPTGWWKGEIVGNVSRNGLFPSKDVEIVDESQVESQDIDSIPDFVPQMARYGSAGTSPVALVHKPHENQSQAEPEVKSGTMSYPFYAENDGEITVEAGETIWIVEEKGDGWTFVQNSEGYYGLVPSEYVKKKEEVKAPTLQVPQAKPMLKPVSPLLSNRGSMPLQAPTSPVPTRKPPQNALKYRAVFKYDARNTNELTFAKGDTVIVTEQTGKNWWRGKIGNREGRFPASYVRELDEKTNPEEQLDRAHAKFTKMSTTYEEKIKRLEAELAQLSGLRGSAYSSQQPSHVPSL